MAVEPKSRANALLAQGVRASEPELVRQALAEGASPDVYLTAWSTSALSLAFRNGNEEVMELLVQAGADPFFTKASGALVIRPLHEDAVRNHPRWGAHFLTHHAGRIASLHASDLGGFLQHMSGDSPNDNAWMDQVRLHGAKGYTPTNWWSDAFKAHRPGLARYVRHHFAPLEAQRLVRLLETTATNSLQRADSMMEVLASYPVPVQVELYLNVALKENHSGPNDSVIPVTKGLLEWSTQKLTAVSTALWTHALSLPEVVAALREQGRAKDFAFLSMWLDPSVSLLGLSLLSDADAAQALNRGDNLIDAHTKRPDWELSIKLLRTLVKKGCKPTQESLVNLCRCMTYSTRERKLAPLFKEWVKAGVDPAPEGKPPAWKAVRQDERTGVGRRLEAWHRSFVLEQRLDAAPAPVQRRRM